MSRTEHENNAVGRETESPRPFPTPAPGVSGFPPEYQVLWRLNERCNFRCAYCFREGVDSHRADEHPDCGKYPPEHIARRFDATGKTWRIHLAGGEPFLYPRFLELAQAVAQRHRLSVNTNLCSPAARGFASHVAPARVHSVNATLHIREIDKRGLMARWMETFRYFQDKGFNICLMYLTHPDFLSRMAADLKRFRAQGVQRTCVKIFRGPWKGRRYPAAFTRDERRLIQQVGLPEDEQRILGGRVFFFSLYCAAGCTCFNMDVAGNLTRCSGVNTPHGNLFERRFHPDSQPRRAPALTCACPYQGMRFAEKVNLRVSAFRGADGKVRISVRRCEPDAPQNPQHP